MNADASADVAADVELAGRVPVLLAVAIGMAIFGVVIAAGAAALLVWATRDEERLAAHAARPERRVPGHPRGQPRPGAEPLAVARQVVPGDPAPRGARLPVGGVRPSDRGGILRNPVHGPLSPVHLRLQRRRDALELASVVLRVQRTRHRPISAVHARERRLPGHLRSGLPGGAVPWTGAGEVVVARNTALHHRGFVHQRPSSGGPPRWAMATASSKPAAA